MVDYYDRLIEFFAMGNIAQDTKETLGAYVRQHAPVPAERQGHLSLTFGHLGQVREGFHITLRASNVTTTAEMRFLVDRIWMEWDWLREQGIDLFPDDQVYRVGQQALAFAHALTALALIPRLPSDRVTFPGRPTYADISVPRSPAEILTRIDEMENVLFDATVKPAGAVEPEPLRRTYGFFETSAWLIFEHVRKFIGG